MTASPDTPLLYVLTEDLQLRGPRFGCGLAQCGSCSVLADGVEIRSCITPVAAVAGKSLTTLEGLAAWYAENKKLAQAPALHPLQQAFLDEQPLHCGYCYNGMTIKGAELLANNPKPSEAEIRKAMNGHICRCGTYPRVAQGNTARLARRCRRDAMSELDASFSRRDLLKSGGAMIIGLSMTGALSARAAAFAAPGNVAGPPEPSAVDTWIAVHADNTATIFFGKCELAWRA